MVFWVADFLSRCFFKVLIILDAIVYHTYVCYDNGRKLINFLIRGTKTWVIMAFRLLMFTLLLAPGWYKLLRYWFLSPLIIRNLRYGKGAKNRNLLDVYLPVPQKSGRGKGSGREQDYNNSVSHKSGAPVVIFVSGGAWTIGYKMWSALVARGLARLGILTVVPDYRNFPQGDIEDMMEDIRLAVEWTTLNAHRFGGDSEKIVLSGQSAGAHITLCLLVTDYLRAQAEKEGGTGKAVAGESCKASKKSAADRFLAEDEESNSEFGGEEDSASGRSDGETPTSTTATTVLSLEDPSAILAPSGATAAIWPSSPSSSTTLNSVEYHTPLKHGGSEASSSRGAFSPEASHAQRPHSSTRGVIMLGESPQRSRRHSHAAVSSTSRPSTSSSRRYFHVQEDTSRDTGLRLNISGGSLPASLKKSRSSASPRARSSSFGHNASSNNNRDLSNDGHPHHTHHRPNSASFLGLIDSYLDANISASRDTESTSMKFIGSAATSLKRGFREQLKRNSRIAGTEFDVPGDSYESSSPDDDPEGASCSGVEEGVEEEEEGQEEGLEDGEGEAPAARVPSPTAAPALSMQDPKTPDNEPLWRDVPSVHKAGGASPTAEFLSAFSPLPARADAAAAITPFVVDPSLEVSATAYHDAASPPEELPAVRVSYAASSVRSNASPRRVAAKHLLSGANSKRTKRAKFNVAAHVKLFIGVSGPYNLTALESHIHKRGLDISILKYICRGDVAAYSPTTLLADYAVERAQAANTAAAAAAAGAGVGFLGSFAGVMQGEGETTGGTEEFPRSSSSSSSAYPAFLPSAALKDFTPIALFHGSRDASIPVSICTELADVLHTHGANVLCKVYEGWSHTDAILEAPLSGTMRLFHDMAGVIFAHTAESSSTPGSSNGLVSLSGASSLDKLVLPEALDAVDNESYSCSPLDYVSLFLFPQLFGGVSSRTQQRSHATHASASACSTDGGAGSEDSTAPAGRHTRQAGATRKASLRKKTKAAKQSITSGGSAPMVSQLLVKIAREINPF